MSLKDQAKEDVLHTAEGLEQFSEALREYVVGLRDLAEGTRETVTVFHAATKEIRSGMFLFAEALGDLQAKIAPLDSPTN